MLIKEVILKIRDVHQKGSFLFTFLWLNVIVLLILVHLSELDV